MTVDRHHDSWTLRWYPPRWRQRYGEEFVALMEDSLSGARPSFGLRLSIVRAGLRERAHEAGLIGTAQPAGERLRAAALAVLCAWTAFALAGARFAKYSEHFQSSMAPRARSTAVDAFHTLEEAAAASVALIAVGAVLALPAVMRFLQAGGWASVRRHVRRAAWSTAVAFVAFGGLVTIAHSLTVAQRNGGFWPYSVVFIATAVLVSTALVMWTAAAVVTARRLVFSRRLLTAEAVLAAAVTLTLVLMTAATAAWWGAVASSAPWFLQGTAFGSAGSAFEAQLALTMALMVGATVFALVATQRAARSWWEWRLR